MRMLRLLIQSNFDHVIVVQADFVVQQDIHKAGAVKHDICQPAVVTVLIVSHGHDFLAYPLTQVN
jgi:hypothetical protein